MAKEVGDTEFCHLRCRPHRGAFSAYLKNIWGFRGTGVLRRYAHLAEATLSQCHESISDVWCCRTVSKEPRQPRPRVLVIAFPWMIYGEFQDHVAQVSCDPSYPRSCSYAATTWCRAKMGRVLAAHSSCLALRWNVYREFRECCVGGSNMLRANRSGSTNPS